jgi:tripartite-type tricarboxylate transporter receptor subunit TctC
VQSLSRRVTLNLCVAAAAMSSALAWAQSGWPNGPVKIIVPFSAGGAADTLTRRVAERLQAQLGGTWSVENKTGAGGNIGMEAVKGAAPDGHTLASATIGTLSINQHLFAKLPYNPVSDFSYVSLHWQNCNVFVVAPSHPSRNVTEFIQWAKSRPKGVSYGSAGVGTTPHLAGALFASRLQLNAVHVPFRGAAQSMPALMGGEVDFAIDNIASYMSLIKGGKVKVLATTCPQRWPTLPEVPTMAEAGVPDFVITSWGALVMPKGTPAAIVAKVSEAIGKNARDPAVKEQFLNIGALAVATSPKETEAFAERERAKWQEVVRIAGLEKR